jgi:hypothetical protein
VFVSKKRDTKAATRFFAGAIAAHGTPSEVTTDRAPALARAISELLSVALHDTTQYTNNRVQADHGLLRADSDRCVARINETRPPASSFEVMPSSSTSAVATMNWGRGSTRASRRPCVRRTRTGHVIRKSDWSRLVRVPSVNATEPFLLPSCSILLQHPQIWRHFDPVVTSLLLDLPSKPIPIVGLGNQFSIPRQRGPTHFFARCQRRSKTEHFHRLKSEQFQSI